MHLIQAAITSIDRVCLLVAGLWAGFLPIWARFAPMATLQLVIFDLISAKFNIHWIYIGIPRYRYVCTINVYNFHLSAYSATFKKYYWFAIAQLHALFVHKRMTLPVRNSHLYNAGWGAASIPTTEAVAYVLWFKLLISERLIKTTLEVVLLRCFSHALNSNGRRYSLSKWTVSLCWIKYICFLVCTWGEQVLCDI